MLGTTPGSPKAHAAVHVSGNLPAGEQRFFLNVDDHTTHVTFEGNYLELAGLLAKLTGELDRVKQAAVELTPHASEADVDRALNCEQGPESRPSFTPSVNYPDLETDVQPAREIWEF